MQIGLRQGLVDAALIGSKGTAALQHQCDPLKRRALSRDMGLPKRRLTARHCGPPLRTVRCSTIPRVVETIIRVVKALNAVSRAFGLAELDRLGRMCWPLLPHSHLDGRRGSLTNNDLHRRTK